VVQLTGSVALTVSVGHIVSASGAECGAVQFWLPTSSPRLMARAMQALLMTHYDSARLRPPTLAADAAPRMFTLGSHRRHS